MAEGKSRRPPQHWSQRRLALAVPMRGQRHESGVAQFLVVKPKPK